MRKKKKKNEQTKNKTVHYFHNVQFGRKKRKKGPRTDLNPGSLVVHKHKKGNLKPLDYPGTHTQLRLHSFYYLMVDTH